MKPFPPNVEFFIVANGGTDWEDVRDGWGTHRVRMTSAFVPQVVECEASEDKFTVEATRSFSDLDAARRHYRRLLRLVERAQRLEAKLRA
jgi:hypothetical protein